MSSQTNHEFLQEIEKWKNRLLDSYDKKPIVYIGYTKLHKNVCKFGYTNDIKRRIKEHRSQIDPNFMPEYMIETVYNREVEHDIKTNLQQNIISQRINDKFQTELILFDEELDMEKLYELILSYKESHEFDDKEMITKLQQEINDLKFKKSDKIDELEEINEIVEEKEEELKNRTKGTIFKCSSCDYQLYFKINVEKHITKKNKCSDNVLTVVMLETEIKCDHCNKFFSSMANKTRHLKICKVKDS